MPRISNFFRKEPRSDKELSLNSNSSTSGSEYSNSYTSGSEYSNSSTSTHMSPNQQRLTIPTSQNRSSSPRSPHPGIIEVLAGLARVIKEVIEHS